MPADTARSPKRWLQRLGRLARELEARFVWHDYKAGAAPWAEMGSMVERSGRGRSRDGSRGRPHRAP